MIALSALFSSFPLLTLKRSFVLIVCLVYVQFISVQLDKHTRFVLVIDWISERRGWGSYAPITGIWRSDKTPYSCHTPWRPSLAFSISVKSHLYVEIFKFALPLKFIFVIPLFIDHLHKFPIDIAGNLIKRSYAGRQRCQRIMLTLPEIELKFILKRFNI